LPTSHYSLLPKRPLKLGYTEKKFLVSFDELIAAILLSDKLVPNLHRNG
jgi:hypothetical protein